VGRAELLHGRGGAVGCGESQRYGDKSRSLRDQSAASARLERDAPNFRHREEWNALHDFFNRWTMRRRK